MQEGTPIFADGIGAVRRGDLLTVIYAGSSTLERTTWAFERGADCCEMSPTGAMVLMLIPASSRPPDAATRAAIDAGYTRLGKRLRFNVTVPEGNPFHRSAVRLIMGAHNLLQQKGDAHRVVDSVQEAIRLLRKQAGASTPSAAQITQDVDLLRVALQARGPSISRNPTP